MARVKEALAACLQLLWLVAKRDVQSLSTVVTNNLFLCAVFLVQGAQRQLRQAFWSSLLFQIILLLPLLAVASSDVVNRIPQERLVLWPLTRMQHLLLRWFSLLMNPVIWVLLILYLRWMGVIVAISFLIVAAAMQLLAMLGGRFSSGQTGMQLMSLVPRFPGPYGGIVQVELRNVFRTLDFYAAFLLSIAGASYRFFSSSVQAEAFPILALLVAISTSTYAQRSFALDAPAGTARYKLLPIEGWRLLLAKDAAYIAVVALLVLPLNLRAGLAFAVTALAIGRYPALRQPVGQRAWRFTGGDIRFCIAQILVGGLAGLAAVRVSLWVFVPVVIGYGVSLYLGDRWWSGRVALRA